MIQVKVNVKWISGKSNQYLLLVLNAGHVLQIKRKLMLQLRDCVENNVICLLLQEKVAIAEFYCLELIEEILRYWPKFIMLDLKYLRLSMQSKI